MPVNEIRQRTQTFVSSLASHRILLYTMVSTIAVSAAITNALKNQSNFYSVTIWLSKSNRSVVVLVNFGFLLALLCGHIAQRIFFGPLRAPEVERLYDRLWFFITESLLAFTIFRDEFDIPFALMFTFLLFVKSFHWLAADRIEWMDQRPYPGPPPLFHFRMASLFLILWSIDCFMFLIAAESILTNDMSGIVLFASEYAILIASALNIIAKYLLSVFELRRASQRGGENAPPWENKSIWVFYIELATDFLKLSTYLVFFTIIIIFYGLPLNIIRDVYITARSFVTRLRALHRYQTATRNMDQRYPNATQEDLTAMSDRTCIICREEMVLRDAPEPGVEEASSNQVPAPAPDGPNTTPKKLPCGHIFHFHCLRSWLERQQSCPTCRRTVLDTNLHSQQTHAGNPIPPEPGVARQPNPFAGQPGQQNRGGFLGRMFGLADQLPIVPGQFAHGQFPQFPAAANNPGVNAGAMPPGVVVQYTIQYQLLRRPLPPQPQPQPQLHPQPQPQLQPQPQTPQTQSPQPAPQYAGFNGPGGVWHPWGMDHRWFVQGLENIAQQPLPSTSTPTPTPTQGPPSSPPGLVTESPANRISSHEPSSIPREATTCQGFPSSPSGGSVNPSSTHELRSAKEATKPQPDTGTTTGSDSIEESQGPSGHDPGPSRTASLESDQTASSVFQPSAQTTRRSSNDTGSGENSLQVPTLIPWYDYGTTTYIQPTHTWTQYPAVSQGPIYNTNGYTPSASQTQPGSHRMHTRPTSTSTPFEPRFHPANPRHHQPTIQPPISQLPPTLTDEQLAAMDTLTRDAIDERLRVLEGVSGAVFRCIDDLMRMRSALPLPTPPAAAPPPAIVPDTPETPITRGTSQTPPPEVPLRAASGESKNPGPIEDQGSKMPAVGTFQDASSKIENVSSAQSGSGGDSSG